MLTSLKRQALAPDLFEVIVVYAGREDYGDLRTRFELNITAVQAAGNLLGNLLCAVAGLLDGTPLSGLLGQVSALLTSIFAILRA